MPKSPQLHSWERRCHCLPPAAASGSTEPGPRFCGQAQTLAAIAGAASPKDDADCAAARARIFSNYSDVIPDVLPSTLPPSRGIEHTIELMPGAGPQRGRPFRQGDVEQRELKRMVADMLHQDLIKRSRSPFAAPAFLVRKPDGKEFRMVIDYRRLNEVTVKNAYPMPLPAQLYDETRKGRYFSKIDLRTGFCQIRVAEEDTHKTAFTAGSDFYEFRVLPMGLCNAPATFMRLMNETFAAERGKFVVVYLDDILVYSETVKERGRGWRGKGEDRIADGRAGTKTRRGQTKTCLRQENTRSKNEGGRGGGS